MQADYNLELRMSSLVAGYGTSDEEEDEMELETTSYEKPTPAAVQQGKSDELNANSIEGSGLKLTSLLPKPKVIGQSVRVGDGGLDIGPIPPKKTYGDEETLEMSTTAASGPSSSFSGFPAFTAKKSAKGVMQISIPSLKDVSLARVTRINIVVCS